MKQHFGNNLPKSCQQARIWLTQQQEEPLLAHQSARLQTHLNDCAACRQWVEQMSWLDGRLQAEQVYVQPLTAAERADSRATIQRRIWRNNIMLQSKQALQGMTILAVIALVAGLIIFKPWQNKGAELSSNFETDRVAQQEPVRITFAAPASHERLYAPLIEDFQQNNALIRVQYVPLDEQSSPSLAQIATMADTAVLPGAVETDATAQFRPLTPLMTADDGFTAAAFWPNILQGCATDGLQLGLPIRAYPTVMLYNQDAFDQAGIPYPQAGWTWDDLQTAVQATASTDHYGYLETLPIRTLGPFVEPWLNTNDPDQLASALQWYVTLAQQNVIGDSELVGEIPDLIRSGNIALWADSFFALQSEWQSVSFPIGLAPFPATNSNQATTPIRTSCAVISAGSQQAETAWTWLTYLSQNPPIDIQYGIPAYMEAADVQNYWGQINEAAVIRVIMQNGWYGQRHPQLTNINIALQTSLDEGTELAHSLANALSIATITTQPTPEPTPAAVLPPQPTPTQEPLAIPEGALTAVYYVSNDAHTSLEAVAALADAFNDQQDDMYIIVTNDRSSFAGGFEYVFAANTYDCFASPSASVNTYNALPSDFFLDLDPFLDTTEGTFLQGFHPAQLEAARFIDGHLYGLPLADRPTMMYYNATHLESLGLEPPSIDWDMDDFWALAAAATDDTHYGYLTIPIISANPVEFMLDEANLSYYQVNGANASVTFDDPDLINLLEQVAALTANNTIQLYDGGGTRSMYGNSRSFINLFRNGQGVMWPAPIGAPQGLPLGIHNILTTQLSYEIAIAPTPWPTVWRLGRGDSLFISRQAENPQVCWEWFQFLSAHPMDAFRGMPARRSVLASPEWADAVGVDQAEIYRAVADNMVYELSYPPQIPQPLNQWWQDALAAIVFDGVDAGEALRALQPKAQAFLDCVTAAMIDLDIPSSAWIDNDTYDLFIACARDVDPTFRSVEELVQSGE